MPAVRFAPAAPGSFTRIITPGNERDWMSFSINRCARRILVAIGMIQGSFEDESTMFTFTPVNLDRSWSATALARFFPVVALRRAFSAEPIFPYTQRANSLSATSLLIMARVDVARLCRGIIWAPDMV